MKATVKKIFFASLYYLGITNLVIKVAFKKKENFPVVIIIYHRIVKNNANEINRNQTIVHSLDNFKKEMKFLKRYFNIVSLDKAVHYIENNNFPKQPTVAITFDDGYEDNYTLAFPILKRMNMPATIFLTTGFIDTKELPLVEKLGQIILKTKKTRLDLNSSLFNLSCELISPKDKRRAFDALLGRLKKLQHDERIKLAEEVINQLGMVQSEEIRMMKWQEAMDMMPYGISFGAHTVTHPDLAKMQAESAKKEIVGSRKIIEERLGVVVNHFAYPFGFADNFTEDLKEYCKTIGFSSVSSAIYGANKPGGDIYSLKRMSPGDTLPIFAANIVRAFLRN